MCTRSQEKGTVTQQETGPDCPWVSGLACGCARVSGRGVGQWWPATSLRALRAAGPAWDLLKSITIIFITSTIVWPQINSRERTQLHPSTGNWIKDLLSMALPIIIRHGVSPSVSLSHQEASISPLSFSIRGQTD